MTNKADYNSFCNLTNNIDFNQTAND